MNATRTRVLKLVALTAALDAELGVRGVEQAAEIAVNADGVDARRAEGAK